MVRVMESLKNVIVNKDGKLVMNDVEATSKTTKVKQSLSDLKFLGYQYGILLAHQSDRWLPRTKFKNSLFSTTKKTGHEHAGVCLNFLLAILSDRGQQILLRIE